MEGVGVMAETAWSLVPPVITIVLALVTKEVYMSLAIGIFIGAFMFTGFNFLGAIDTMFDIMSNKVGGNVNSRIPGSFGDYCFSDSEIRSFSGVW